MFVDLQDASEISSKSAVLVDLIQQALSIEFERNSPFAIGLVVSFNTLAFGATQSVLGVDDALQKTFVHNLFKFASWEDLVELSAGEIATITSSGGSAYGVN